jgi:hypothetical protein
MEGTERESHEAVLCGTDVLAIGKYMKKLPVSEESVLEVLVRWMIELDIRGANVHHIIEEEKISPESMDMSHFHKVLLCPVFEFDNVEEAMDTLDEETIRQQYKLVKRSYMSYCHAVLEGLRTKWMKTSEETQRDAIFEQMNNWLMATGRRKLTRMRSEESMRLIKEDSVKVKEEPKGTSDSNYKGFFAQGYGTPTQTKSQQNIVEDKSIQSEAEGNTSDNDSEKSGEEESESESKDENESEPEIDFDDDEASKKACKEVELEIMKQSKLKDQERLVAEKKQRAEANKEKYIKLKEQLKQINSKSVGNPKIVRGEQIVPYQKRDKPQEIEKVKKNKTDDDLTEAEIALSEMVITDSKFKWSGDKLNEPDNKYKLEDTRKFSMWLSNFYNEFSNRSKLSPDQLRCIIRNRDLLDKNSEEYSRKANWLMNKINLTLSSNLSDMVMQLCAYYDGRSTTYDGFAAMGVIEELMFKKDNEMTVHDVMLDWEASKFECDKPESKGAVATVAKLNAKRAAMEYAGQPCTEQMAIVKMMNLLRQAHGLNSETLRSIIDKYKEGKIKVLKDFIPLLAEVKTSDLCAKAPDFNITGKAGKFDKDKEDKDDGGKDKPDKPPVKKLKKSELDLIIKTLNDLNKQSEYELWERCGDKVICYKCGQEGHKSIEHDNCPLAHIKVTCAKCHGEGHVVGSCDEVRGKKPGRKAPYKKKGKK